MGLDWRRNVGTGRGSVPVHGRRRCRSIGEAASHGPRTAGIGRGPGSCRRSTRAPGRVAGPRRACVRFARRGFRERAYLRSWCAGDGAPHETAAVNRRAMEARIRSSPVLPGRHVDGAASRLAAPMPRRARCPFIEVPGHDAESIAAGLAQLVEQLPCKHQVASSSLAAGTNPFPCPPVRGMAGIRVPIARVFQFAPLPAATCRSPGSEDELRVPRRVIPPPGARRFPLRAHARIPRR